MSAVPWILGAVALVVAGQLLLKVGMLRVGVIGQEQVRSPFVLLVSIARQPAVVLGLLIYAASALLWLFVLSQSELSFAFPFLSLAYAGVSAAATVLLKEHFEGRQWLGLVLVTVGVIAVAASGA
ncbi:MAG TPA: transporter [Coriobacteriia bacterium]|nr:transporter [Coriobacteriia bacterium]